MGAHRNYSFVDVAREYILLCTYFVHTFTILYFICMYMYLLHHSIYNQTNHYYHH